VRQLAAYADNYRRNVKTNYDGEKDSENKKYGKLKNSLYVQNKSIILYENAVNRSLTCDYTF